MAVSAAPEGHQNGKRRLGHPLFIVADSHLGHGDRPRVASDLARLARAHAGHELVLNGDTFDLSRDPPSQPAGDSVAHTLRRYEDLRAAFRDHLAQGHRMLLVAGNHDAAVASPDVRAAFLSTLDLTEEAPLDVSRWFARRGAVHVEHGHVFDPDNAPNHPLAVCTPATEPLGVALTRRFLARAGALEFAHAEETTPLAGLLRTFRTYGPKAVLVVARYFATAAGLAWEAGAQPGLSTERREGARAMEAFARDVGLDADALRQLALGSARPTHHSRVQSFFRLYLDRSLATAALAASLPSMAYSSAGAGVAAVSAAYLGFSVARGVNRYGGRLGERLESGAHAIRELTSARLVVLGHTHRPRETEGYLNPGSFAYPSGSGRGYVVVDRYGAGERRCLAG